MEKRKTNFIYPECEIICFSSEDLVITGSIWQPDLDDLAIDYEIEKK